jgi:hypothetical protein
MKVPIGLLLLFASLVTLIEAFTASSSPPGRHHLQHRWFASTQEEGATTAVKTPKSKTQQLGLLTFDLDDTLYPIELVVRAANGTLNVFGVGCWFGCGDLSRHVVRFEWSSLFLSSVCLVSILVHITPHLIY